MNDTWSELVVKGIALAIYVAPRAGKAAHSDRPFHGLVLNDPESVRDYCFSDGRVMRTEGGALFYLPKGSTYTIKTIAPGGCHAINFDADLFDEPFVMRFRDTEPLLKSFKCAVKEWRCRSSSGLHGVMRSLYDILYQIQIEREKEYVSGATVSCIQPAVEYLSAHFAENELSVSGLAEMCGISEVYFRRIFSEYYGISPKEYVIRMRLEYAKELLLSGQLSVGETAELCGYAEPCHFSREFHKRVGCSPAEYKRG